VKISIDLNFLLTIKNMLLFKNALNLNHL